MTYNEVIIWGEKRYDIWCKDIYLWFNL